jgi:hypothetical protein
MPANREKPGDQAALPPWALGDIAALVAVVLRPGTAGPPEQIIAAMHAALPVWAADPVRYAEHLGCLADVHYMRFERSHDPAELDHALQVWAHVRLAAPGLSGLIASRPRMFGVQLEMASALQRSSPAGLAASLSATCTALRSELRHLGSPSLLGDPARAARRWADTAISHDQWQAAAGALELGAGCGSRATAQVARRGQDPGQRGVPPSRS